ncbi:hypothetical protein BLOT_015849 [Blomia tropicalis]|nr:hypothetical protein BLOT_015849 [Blomia tropicalis]
MSEWSGRRGKFGQKSTNSVKKEKTKRRRTRNRNRKRNRKYIPKESRVQNIISTIGNNNKIKIVDHRLGNVSKSSKNLPKSSIKSNLTLGVSPSTSSIGGNNLSVKVKQIKQNLVGTNQSKQSDNLASSSIISTTSSITSIPSTENSKTNSTIGSNQSSSTGIIVPYKSHRSTPIISITRTETGDVECCDRMVDSILQNERNLLKEFRQQLRQEMEQTINFNSLLINTMRETYEQVLQAFSTQVNQLGLSNVNEVVKTETGLRQPSQGKTNSSPLSGVPQTSFLLFFMYIFLQLAGQWLQVDEYSLLSPACAHELIVEYNFC